ncbi:MAG: hypothetical protein ACFE0O_14065 [Opitutales bacterium]
MRSLLILFLGGLLSSTVSSLALSVGSPILVDEAKVFGSGWSGGPDPLPQSNIFTEGTFLDLNSTSATTDLHTVSVSWTDASNNPVTYAQLINGGLDQLGSDGSVTIAGNISLMHDAIDPGTDFIWYGTADIGLDIEFTTPVLVDFQLNANNNLLGSNPLFRSGLGIYSGFSWDNFQQGAGTNETTNALHQVNYSTTLAAGQYRFDMWGAIWNEEPDWLGGNIALDYDLTLTPVPEPEAIGLALGMGALLLSLRRTALRWPFPPTRIESYR